jgi:hypothetical protein
VLNFFHFVFWRFTGVEHWGTWDLSGLALFLAASFDLKQKKLYRPILCFLTNFEANSVTMQDRHQKSSLPASY